MPGGHGRAATPTPGRRTSPTAACSYELDAIGHMGYVDYFLIVWDFIHYAKSQGIMVGPGRGSGAGSIVAYSLGITMLDPLKYNLLFERFLNPERVTMPDIDVDFCYERRQEVIDYVARKYGEDHVSADHHLRHHGGQGRHPGRGPGAGHELPGDGRRGQGSCPSTWA